jgi:L-threonylcarbamoyladenylate synthase
MHTEVFRIDTPAHFALAVEKAASLLRRGELVAVPTETVYGLAANALDPQAVERIYAVKGRPAANPIIVHVDSIVMARRCVGEWPEPAARLAALFWPGPLTLVLRKSDLIPQIVSAGGETVGLRCPAHPFMRALITACGFPLAAPSANVSNQVSPTSAEHVLRRLGGLGGRIPLIVDAGPSSVGIESTVLDLSVAPPRVLRAGMIAAGQIGRELGIEVQGPCVVGQTAGLKSPGLLRKHYAPRARMLVARWENDDALEELVRSTGVPVGKVNVIAHEHIPSTCPYGRVAIIPHDPEAYARALYAELHQSDDLGAELILVEEVPSGEEWLGIRDRLTRASARD